MTNPRNIWTLLDLLREICKAYQGPIDAKQVYLEFLDWFNIAASGMKNVPRH
jgi:hypothetical protein